MTPDTLTGSRIRERRSILGVRQAQLARQVGISASYLNLIEHNRRRIGGKLLVDIARELQVEPSMLTEGAEAALIAALREAAADSGVATAETGRVDEFAGRFAGWAEVLAASHRRIVTLERTVQTLSDRLTHDPHLAASLHEVLSTAASIRSTASILAESQDLEVAWQERFHRNIHQDSLRLADSSKALMAYLDEGDSAVDSRGAPQEEAEAFLGAHHHHFPDLEAGGTVDAVIQTASGLASSASRQIARGILNQYAADARAMPLAEMRAELSRHGPHPLALAQAFGTGLAAVLRRMAALPPGMLSQEVGLLICDASGSIVFRKPVEGFALPRFGASCPLWPVFAALSHPMKPLRRELAQLGRTAARFECVAIAEPAAPVAFDTDPLYRSTMLITPLGAADPDDTAALPVGSSCRVCPKRSCPARREPSVLGEEF